MFLLAWVRVVNSQFESIIKAACILPHRNRFEIALLIQSIFMILAQVRITVHVCNNITHDKIFSWHYFIFASFTDRVPAPKISPAQRAFCLFGNGLPIHSISNS